MQKKIIKFTIFILITFLMGVFFVGLSKDTFYSTKDLPSAAWTDDDNKVIYAMKKGLKLVISGKSSRGTVTNDTYTLKGFTSSYTQLLEDC